MSKTTRSSDKDRPEMQSQRAASIKEKSIKKKSPVASNKQETSQASMTSLNKTVRGSDKKKPAQGERTSPGKSTSIPQIAVLASPEDVPSQLLRRTKTTASALVYLEKGIESIYRKDFKKALAELQSLIEKYPNESDITSRARSYLDICRRGEARQKKTSTTHDQTYALGILEHNNANYDKAITYFQQSLEKYPCADYIYYSIAASMALKGNISAAIENLCKAVDLNTDSRVHAKNDPDFAVLEDSKEFQDLIGIVASRHL